MLRISLIIVALVAGSALYNDSNSKQNRAVSLPHNPGQPSKRLSEKAAEALQYVQGKKYNDDFGLLIDMSIPSSKERFFIYDFKGDSILAKGLVTHGSCNEWWLSEQRYSNVEGSGCSSLGRYKVGVSYFGKFGKAWKLHGLDSENSNAFKRYVVLHSHECVPEAPNGEEICQSLGCPTVSPGFLNKLDKLLTGSKKPVLLWMYQEKNV